MKLFKHQSHRALRRRRSRDESTAAGRKPFRPRARTLYELLGVRSDCTAEALRNAFRDAAKANHPDLNPSDPDAPWRFRQTVSAYRILRDAEQRAAYDQLLARGRAQHRARLVRTIASDAIAIVTLAVIVFVGYMLLQDALRIPDEATSTVEVAVPKRTRMTAIRPDTAAYTSSRGWPLGGLVPVPGIHVMPSDMTSRLNISGSSVVASSDSVGTDPVEPTVLADRGHRGGPRTTPRRLAEASYSQSAVSSGANRHGSVAGATYFRGERAGADDNPEAGVDRNDRRNRAEQRGKGDNADAPDQGAAQLTDPALSSNDIGEQRSSSTRLAKLDDRRAMRTISRLPAHEAQPASDRVPFRQAALESSDMPRLALESRSTRTTPLFGVGF